MIDPLSAWLPFEPTETTPWTYELAAHLFRRAAFGANQATCSRAVSDGPGITVDRLLNPDGVEAFDQLLSHAANLLGAGDEAPRVVAWWLYRMRHSPDPLGEQLVLFWHNHFATSADKVKDAELLLRQNLLFRERSRGRFGDLLKAIAEDPAMLIYLDCTENRKRQPNENFAREIMELFALGLDQYSQQDIKELARCFTGAEVRRREYRFNPYEHDTGIKVLLDTNGNFDGNQAIDLLLQQTTAANFIATKLIRWFVCDQPLNQAFVEPLSRILRDHDYDIGHATSTILRSRIFYSSLSVGQQIRSPVSLVVGWLRGLDATTDVQQLLRPLREMGQAPLYPPNVAGWPAGMVWLNSQSMIARSHWIRDFAHSGQTRFEMGNADNFARSLGTNARQRLQHLELSLLAIPLTNANREELLGSLEDKPPGEQVRAALDLLALLPQVHIA